MRTFENVTGRSILIRTTSAGLEGSLNQRGWVMAWAIFRTIDALSVSTVKSWSPMWSCKRNSSFSPFFIFGLCNSKLPRCRWENPLSRQNPCSERRRGRNSLWWGTRHKSEFPGTGATPARGRRWRALPCRQWFWPGCCRLAPRSGTWSGKTPGNKVLKKTMQD